MLHGETGEIIIYETTNMHFDKIVQTTNKLLRQRARSTCQPEREPAMAKRLLHRRCNQATGKGPKSEQLVLTNSSAHLNNTDRDQLSTEVPKWLKRLSVLAMLKTDQKAQRLWALINERDLWIAAYKKLASSPGSLTRGGDDSTIDGYSMKILDELRSQVYKGEYRFGLTRRVYIPKPQGGRRPLGVPEFRDRLVQEVVRIILEVVYEPRFSDNSHGFRPGRSQHTCMRQIRRDFSGTKWYIEGDISNWFSEGKPDHYFLRKQLHRHIQDYRLINLVCQGLKTKVLMPNRSLQSAYAGTPQGGICSPLLSNIALNQLDRFMNRLKLRINRGVRRKPNLEYNKVLYRRTKALRQGKALEAKRLLKEMRQLPRGQPDDPDFRRLNYVRYADDFLIGITGPVTLAKRVKSLVQRFLKNRLKLRLKEDKTVITQAKNNKIPFLGFRIQHGPTMARVFVRRYGGKNKKVKCVRGGYIRLLADTQKVINKLAETQFCTKDGTPKPNFRYLQDPQSYTVARVSSLLRGIDNYYKIANNRRQSISRIMYIVRSSIAKMFAAKFKLASQSKVYARAGKDLSRPIKAKRATPVGATDSQAQAWAKEAGGRLKGTMPALPFTRYTTIPKPEISPLPRGWVASPKKRLGKANGSEKWLTDRHEHFDFLNKIRVRSGRGRTALEAECAMCGSTENIEIHHVRALKDLKGKTPVERVMIAAKRKSIPLCRSCHMKQHGRRQWSK